MRIDGVKEHCHEHHAIVVNAHDSGDCRLGILVAHDHMRADAELDTGPRVARRGVGESVSVRSEVVDP